MINFNEKSRKLQPTLVMSSDTEVQYCPREHLTLYSLLPGSWIHCIVVLFDVRICRGGRAGIKNSSYSVKAILS